MDPQMDGFTFSKLLAVQNDLQGWRLARDDEGLRLTIDGSIAVTQHQSDGMDAVFHIYGGQKARLPDIFFLQMAQGLGQPKGKESDDRHNRRISPHAQHRIARAYDARPQERTRHSKERRIRRNKLVFARQPDNFLDAGLVFAIALD